MKKKAQPTRRDPDGVGVRLKDVAKELNLSISTVNAILHNRPNFNAETKKRVLQKVKELNYRPNWLARSLATRKTHVIGIVVPNFAGTYFPDLVEGVDEITHAAGYHLVVCNTHDDAAREDDEIATLVNKQVDGLIIASAHPPGDKGVWKALAKSSTPFVLVDRFFQSTAFVGLDNELIGYMATKQLIEQGYRVIAHLSRRDVRTGIGRWRGYQRALRMAGIRVRHDYVVDVVGEAGGYDATKKLLQLDPRPDAIFATADPIAIGAMQAIEEFGLSIPQDIGVIGVGKVRYGEHLRIPLSTIDQHPLEVGRLAATVLLGLCNGQTPPENPILLQPTLVVRSSSRRSA
jgi:LacI family transcriptional regulator